MANENNYDDTAAGEQQDALPRTEPIRIGRPARTRGLSGRLSGSRSRAQSQQSRGSRSRRNSPHLHRIASHLDDHSGYVHEHSAGHSESEDEPLEEAESNDAAFDSQESYGEKEKDEEVPEVRDGILDERDVEDQAPPLERKATSKSVKDPNLVTWEGPDDPENPKNWSKKRKWLATIVVSSFTFISPVSSSMVAPALSTMAAQFHVTNEVESQLMLSIFILAYAIGPLFLGPMSEIYGRVIVLQVANAFYFVFNLACGFAQSSGQMIAFRFLSGLGGSAPLSIGGGVIGDAWQAHERGRAISIYSLMPLLGPAVGPIAGGFITENTTWR